MKQTQTRNLTLWQFENLTKETSIRHFVTGRNSAAHKNEFSLSFSNSPHGEAIKINRSLLASSLDIDDSRLYFPIQIHKTTIAHVTAQTLNNSLADTDALITSEKNICIAVMSADCVPILLYDRRNKAAAAIHAGWRGTVARILEKTLHKMNEKFGTTGLDITAAIGPSVCQDSYEVGEEVIDSVNRTFGKDNGLMIEQTGRKAKFDLWKANTIQLLEFGVSESQIEISNLCTVKNNNHFFSARKGDTGRFAAGIMLI